MIVDNRSVKVVISGLSVLLIGLALSGCGSYIEDCDHAVLEVKKLRQLSSVEKSIVLPERWRSLSYGGEVFITEFQCGQLIVFRTLLGRGYDFNGYLYAEGVGPYKVGDRLKVNSRVPLHGIELIEVRVSSVVNTNWYGIDTDFLN